MNIRRTVLVIKEKIQIKLHMPYMKTRVTKYRYDGVSIGSDCQIKVITITDKLNLKYQQYTFDFTGMNKESRVQTILLNENKLIIR